MEELNIIKKMKKNNQKQLGFLTVNRLIFKEKQSLDSGSCQNFSLLEKQREELKDKLKQAIKNKEKAVRLKLEKEIHECDRKEGLVKEYQKLQKRFLKIKNDPYAIFAVEDPKVYKFLEQCSLKDLQDLCIIKTDDALIKYMDVEGAWVTAGKRKSDSDYWENLRAKVMAAPDVKVTPALIQSSAVAGMGGLIPLLKEMGIENSFSKHITPDMMLAIGIQEVAPATIGSDVKIGSKARLELFRMMCEAGWQPQKMPAMWDSAISFGIGQMTLYTHKLLQKGYGDDTRDFLEGDFREHTNVQQQINDTLLLSYVNLEAFSDIAQKYPKFKKVFEKATDEHKKRFLTTIVAAYHNYGNRKALRRGIKKTLASKFSKLEDYRTSFISNIKRLPIAYKHSRNSGILYSFVRHMRNSHVPKEDKLGYADSPDFSQFKEDTPQLLQTASEQADEEEDKKIIMDTLLVRSKKSCKYYTFTAPKVKLHGFLVDFLQPPYTFDDIKAFNGVKFYKIGDILDIPIKFLHPIFRDRRIVRIGLNGGDIREAMDEYMVDGASPKNRSIIMLYGCTRSDEIVFPAKLLKED
jgi:hypothetical protein